MSNTSVNNALSITDPKSAEIINIPICLKTDEFRSQIPELQKVIGDSTVILELIRKVKTNIPYIKIKEAPEDSFDHNLQEVNLRNHSKNNAIRYITKANQNELAEEYRKYFDSDKLTKIGEIIDLAQALTHELGHAYRYFLVGNMYFNSLNQKPETNPDFINKEEERNITETENQYLEERGKPIRVSHRGIVSLSGYETLNEKFNEEKKDALKKYISAGAVIDAIGISQSLNKDEITKVLLDFPKSLKGFSPKYAISSYFIDITYALINERDLKIDFKEPM